MWGSEFTFSKLYMGSVIGTEGANYGARIMVRTLSEPFYMGSDSSGRTYRARITSINEARIFELEMWRCGHFYKRILSVIGLGLCKNMGSDSTGVEYKRGSDNELGLLQKVRLGKSQKY
jgi:hypothetical protein